MMCSFYRDRVGLLRLLRLSLMANNCALGARRCKDGDDPGQQPADPSRQAAENHWRGNEVSGECLLPSSLSLPPSQASGSTRVKVIMLFVCLIGY